MGDLTPEQVALLMAVRVSPGAPTARVARLTRSTPAAVKRIAQELETLGLLERRNHPEHPTANELHVTDAGIEELPAR